MAMTPRASHRRAGPGARCFARPAILLAALLAAPAARAQVADTPPDLGSVARMSLVRTGTYEAWQDTSRLGTEFYRVYATPGGDSLVSVSTVRYELHGQGGLTTYEKWTLGITRSLDSYPLLYQTRESIGGRQRALNVTFRAGTALIFRESEGRGGATAVGMPPGRIYILDPNVYEQIERVVSEFYARGLPSRMQNIIMTPRDTVLEIRLTRGPKENIELPGRGKLAATRVDIFDDLTLIKTWVDDGGLLVRVEAPAQKLRVVRLPPGQAEAAAAAEAKGAPPAPGAAPAKGAAPPRP
jgi:hypothetical protein